MSDNPFEAWLQAQETLEVHSFGHHPGHIGRVGGDDRKDYVRWNAFALEDELHEMTQEIGWKPWATGEFFNREQFIAEAVDVMFFLANLILLATPYFEGELVLRDGSPSDGMYSVRALAAEVWETYLAKVKVNEERMASQTYDGVSDKCPHCHRELEIIEDGLGNKSVRPICPEHGYV